MADKKGTEQVVLRISDSEEAVDARCTIPQTVVESSSSHEISRKPPKIPVGSAVRRTSPAPSSFSKPKSRLIEPPCPNMDSPAEITRATSSKEALKSAPLPPKTPVIGSSGSEDEDDEEVYKIPELNMKERSGKKSKRIVLIQWVAFLCITGCLIASLTIEKLLTKEIWGLGLWKWCVLVLVIFCGRLFSQWFIWFLVFLIKRKFLLKRKVLHFVRGLRKSVIIFIWLALVLLAWGLLVDRSSKRSKKYNEILNYITRALAASLIGAGLWLVKTLLVNILAASIRCTGFFDRIKDSFLHQEILRTLSQPPLMEMTKSVKRAASTEQLRFRHLKKERDGGNKGKEGVIDVDKIKRMKQETISAGTMRGLIDVIISSGLSTISNTIENFKEEEGEQKDKEIKSEWEARTEAVKIFRNIAKPGSKFIDEEDLFRFMSKEEIDNVLPLFEGGATTRKIKRKAMKNWVAKVYNDRKTLVHALNDNNTGIRDLNKLASTLVLIVIIIEWLLLMGFLTTKLLVFISSQLLLVVFMFGNTAKTVFEGIIFAFVMHPFDVGDRCVVDGVQMSVEEMKILTTVFLKYDNEKIFYPNSVLATKPISNFYRSPDMSDAIEFFVDFSTSIESIRALKARIKSYIVSKPQFWWPKHSLVAKEIENVNKMQLALYVNHTINFQNYSDKSSRRSELVFELKKIFEDLGIKYHLLPQEVQLNYASSSSVAPMVPTSGR